uniref:Uncharacterized protein n=1 Tax=Timema douglasi TaxID=61478 RepID=A0A7R8VQ13_TIMDO|nr:unnamed protein product [Timema douglasi]
MKTFLALFSTHQPYIQRRQGVERLQRIFQYVGVLPPFKMPHPIRVRPPCLTLGSHKKKRSNGVPAMLTTVVEAIKPHVSIPPSSDDDRDSLQNENLSHSESGTRPPRRHGRICVPMSFSGIRKQMGKKRFRRYENGNDAGIQHFLCDMPAKEDMLLQSDPFFTLKTTVTHTTH